MKRLVYGLIFLFLASGQAFAVDLVSPIICRLVLENFIRKGKCHENVVCLAKSLTAEIPKFDIAKAKVLYIFSETGIIDRVKYSSSPVYGWNTLEALGGYGDGRAKGWDWHVILEYEIDGVSHVVDPSYNGTPKIRPTTDYFRDMFLREVDEAHRYLRDANDKIVIRSIPAQTYVDTFGNPRSLDNTTTGTKDQFYFMDDPEVKAQYPSEKLSNFLKRR